MTDLRKAWHSLDPPRPKGLKKQQDFEVVDVLDWGLVRRHRTTIERVADREPQRECQRDRACCRKQAR